MLTSLLSMRSLNLLINPSRSPLPSILDTKDCAHSPKMPLRKRGPGLKAGTPHGRRNSLTHCAGSQPRAQIPRPSRSHLGDKRLELVDVLARADEDDGALGRRHGRQGASSLGVAVHLGHDDGADVDHLAANTQSREEGRGGSE